VGGHANPIDGKLRGCDVVALRVEDIAPNGYSVTMDGAGSREVCSDLSAFPRCGCRFIGKRLEAEFWNFLREIAYERQLSLSELINAISQAKSRKNENGEVMTFPTRQHVRAYLKAHMAAHEKCPSTIM
jgi:predicted DNA-binding ribbon-helix-helix protein